MSIKTHDTTNFLKKNVEIVYMLFGDETNF